MFIIIRQPMWYAYYILLINLKIVLQHLTIRVNKDQKSNENSRKIKLITHICAYIHNYILLIYVINTLFTKKFTNTKANIN